MRKYKIFAFNNSFWREIWYLRGLLNSKNMKFIRFCAFVLMLGMVSCASTQKAYKQENYDVVIKNLSEEALSNKISDRDLDMFARAYHQANQRDFNKIVELKKSAQPDIWSEVYWRTYNIWGRNELVGKFSETQKMVIGYKPFDMNEELTSCRNKAEAYLAKKLEVILKSGDDDAEEVQRLLSELKRINPNSAALAELSPKVLIKNAESIKIESNSSAALKLPKDYHSIITDFENNNIKKPELKITISTTNVEISPERCDKVSFEEKSNGTSAKITDSKLSKSATIKGTISFYDNKTKSVEFRMPFEIMSSFNYSYTTIEGDRAACSEQTLKMESKPMPYPTDNSLINDAAKQLNQVVKQKFGLK